VARAREADGGIEFVHLACEGADLASDGAVSDGAVSDGAVSDGAVSDGAVSDGAVSDGAVSDGAARGWRRRRGRWG